MCIRALKLQSRTLNLGNATLIPALMLVSIGFLVELSNIEREREEDVEHSTSTLFLQLLTQILMS